MDDKGKIMQTNILLPETLWEQAKMRAVKDRVSFTEIVRRALTQYLAAESEKCGDVGEKLQKAKKNK